MLTSAGGTPEYVSGHSSFSSAAATVLAGYFCADRRSRVVGGSHFQFSNEAGLKMGRDLAAEILAKKLLYETPPTHHGTCPL